MRIVDFKGGESVDPSVLELLNELSIPVLTSGRRYWLIRTKAGTYFDRFINDGYIGLSWNKVSNSSYFTMTEAKLKEEIIKLYPSEKRPGLVASHILKFATEIKQGDIVLIPNIHSKRVALCEVLDNDVTFAHTAADEIPLENPEIPSDEEELDIADPAGPCLLRKGIRVLEVYDRQDLGPYLSAVLYSHIAITSADNYAEMIDRLLNDVFFKDGRVHLILEVTRETEIPAVAFINSISDLLSACELPEILFDEAFDKDSVEIKVQVQSPGTIELYAANAGHFAMIAITILICIGAKGSFKFCGVEMNFETDGIVEKLLKVAQFVRDGKGTKLSDAECQKIAETALRIERASKELDIKAKKGKK